ncbi:hypothetical protein SRHO_G00096880 [Serrasalmus rhombeus]
MELQAGHSAPQTRPARLMRSWPSMGPTGTTTCWPTLIKPLLSELVTQQKQRLYRIPPSERSITHSMVLQHRLSTASEQQLADLPPILIRAAWMSLVI